MQKNLCGSDGPSGKQAGERDVSEVCTCMVWPAVPQKLHEQLCCFSLVRP
jgi:hypothetical protein